MLFEITEYYTGEKIRLKPRVELYDTRDYMGKQMTGLAIVLDDEAPELRKRCGTTVTGDATSGLTPLLHQFTLNSTWLLRSAPSLTGCFL